VSEPVPEYEHEPIPGLPEVPPEGETILWQGSPDAWALARRAFHVRKVAVYFGVLVAWRIGVALADGLAPVAAVGAAGMLALLAAAALGILWGLAWLNARATIYTITNRRVVMRFGVAVTLAVNFPFRAVRSADAKVYADGTADLPLVVEGVEKLGFLMLWPHVRPWGFGQDVQPMLRAVPDGRAVARLLSRALGASLEPSRLPARQRPDRHAEDGPRRVATAAS